MHMIKFVHQRNHVGLFCFMIIAGLSLMPLSASATISHTKIPEKIRIGITGVLTVEEWNINGNTVENTLERNFKEYIKDVLPHEWYPDDNANAHINILKTGAMANKIFAWWRLNGDTRSSLTGSPDIVDNTADQVYIPLSCTGQETALCKGQTSKRTQNGSGDQAVDDTWSSILKRKDRFRDLAACPDVFEVHYNTTKSGCDASSFASFCIPQDEAKDLPNQGKTWKEILTTYYAPLVIYDQQELAVDGTVELLSTCIEIRRDAGNRIRKYTTEQGYIHTNDFDEHTNPLKRIQYWVDYWDDWNYPENSEPYTFKMNGGDIDDRLTYDLVKAVCFKESKMADINLMQMTPVALQSLSGEQPMNDWNWSVLPDADGDYPLAGIVKLRYTGVSDATEEGSLKWGIRWLYVKKSRAVNGSKPETYRPVWDHWITALEQYNGEAEKVDYAIGVMALYQSGKNPHKGNPDYLWPIMTNGDARQEPYRNEITREKLDVYMNEKIVIFLFTYAFSGKS